MGRVGTAEEMAVAVRVLASDEASYVNGAVLAVDGSSPHVAVKAKRGEGVGAVGRGEGIAAQAVAMLVRPPEPAMG